MNTGRAQATASTILTGPDAGKILIAGGGTLNSVTLASTELYLPATNTFAPANQTLSMNVDRSMALAVQLPDTVRLRSPSSGRV